MDFPMTLNMELVHTLAHIPLCFSRIAFVLKADGTWKPNHAFKATSNPQWGKHRDKAWWLCSPLLTSGVPLREWDTDGYPVGEPIEGYVTDSQTHRWIPLQGGGYEKGVVLVHGTTGYRAEPLDTFVTRIHKPLVHDAENGEYYDVDLMGGTCTCPDFQKNNALVHAGNATYRRGCKHWDHAWLKAVAGK